MYLNPDSHGWACDGISDLDTLLFHRTLPQYAKTPLRQLPKVLRDELQVSEILVKDESDRFGLPAFKILGASWASFKGIAQHVGYGLIHDPEQFEEFKEIAAKSGLCLFTATEGNHGRAVARIAKIFGVRSYVYVPCVMHERTKDLIRQEGASLAVVDGDYNEAVREADRQCNNKGGLLIQDTAWPGYEEVPEWIVEGYSSMMKEVDEQISDLIGKGPSHIITPVGVGSLAHAVVSHYKTQDRRARILAVEPDTAACLKASLENRNITPISTGNTTMCGMNCGTVSCTAWPYLQAGIDGCMTVTDGEAQEAQELLHSSNIHVGPCAAATLAAIKKLSNGDRRQLGINPGSVILLLATEGPR